jgi:hypothetical protein
VGTAARRWALALTVVATVAACGRLRGVPSGRTGWSGFRAGALSFELPEDWIVRGDSTRLRAEPSGGTAQLRVELVDRPFRSEAECLAQAEQSLARGAVGLQRSRRHPTRLGGRPAVVQEGDAGAWHGWAWAACDGRQQYRVSFLAVSPMAQPVFAAQRGFDTSLRFDDAR